MAAASAHAHLIEVWVEFECVCWRQVAHSGQQLTMRMACKLVPEDGRVREQGARLLWSFGEARGRSIGGALLSPRLLDHGSGMVSRETVGVMNPLRCYWSKP